MANNNIYTDAFLENSLVVLGDMTKDLSLWSVHNDDKYNDQISLIGDLVDSIKRKRKQEGLA